MLFGWGIFTNWSIINGKIYIGFTPSTIEGYIYIYTKNKFMKKNKWCLYISCSFSKYS